MNTTGHFKSNSEASFLFASLWEFLHLWKSGKEAVFNVECKGKTASLNFSCSLGHPENPHVGKQRKRRRKSKSQAVRDNARAARHQSRQGAVISPARGGEAYVAPSLDQSDQLVSEEPTVPSVALTSKVQSTPKRKATSPAESLPKRPAQLIVQLPDWNSSGSSQEILRQNEYDNRADEYEDENVNCDSREDEDDDHDYEEEMKYEEDGYEDDNEDYGDDFDDNYEEDDYEDESHENEDESEDDEGHCEDENNDDEDYSNEDDYESEIKESNDDNLYTTYEFSNGKWS